MSASQGLFQKHIDSVGHYELRPLSLPDDVPVVHLWLSDEHASFWGMGLQATRIVVEPDVRNDKIHALNRRAGFRYQRRIELPGKTAHLAFCTRAQFQAALSPQQEPGASPQSAVAHLDPELWQRVNRMHVRKAIGEFAHERLIHPELEAEDRDWGHYRLGTDAPGVEYRFRAQLLSLEHWHIDPAPIEKRVDGAPAPLDSMRFVLELRETLGMDPEMLPTYLEEIASTLYGSAYKHNRPSLSAAELARADFQAVEAAMAEGHPCFIANNGRIGFDAQDYRAYAPEVAAPIQLVWLAARASLREDRPIDP